jgi:site-specific DNA-methyltransferase (adenine-specific)
MNTTTAPSQPRVADLPPHPIALRYPPMRSEEFQDLKADIAKHGQREPIVSYEGKILDGLHRCRACRELGIEPILRDWTEDDGPPEAFVASKNLHRRHLTKDQRAGLLTLDWEAESAEGRRRKSEGGNAAGRVRPQQHSAKSDEPIERQSSAILAKRYDVKRTTAVEAIRIRKHAPALIKRMIQGEVTLAQAKRQIIREQKRHALEAKAAEHNGKPTDWQIIHGHCPDAMKSLEERPRLIFADPPYNIGVAYDDGYNDRVSEQDFLALSRTWIEAAAKLLADDGSLWVLISNEWAAHYDLLLSDAGLFHRSRITWYETFGVNCTNNFNRCSRRLFYTVKDPKRFVFNADAVNRLSDRQKQSDPRADEWGKIWDDVWMIPRLTGTCAERIPGFPTQLPLALLLPIVGCASDPGDLVLDPFSGSATTGAVCLELNRRYIGIERSQEYVELSRLRLQASDVVSSGDRPAHNSS